MTIRRFIIGLGVALLLQGTLFAWQYRDLLYLRQPVAAIEREGQSAFNAHATAALSRGRLTRQHLDTIAESARRLGRLDLEVQALQRRLELDPGDPQARLRLGDALRRAGQFRKAEELYLDVLHAGNQAP